MSFRPHTPTTPRWRRMAQWLLLAVLVSAQTLAFAHELSHHDLTDSDWCAVCSVGGDLEGDLRTTVQPPAGPAPDGHFRTALPAPVATQPVAAHAPRGPPLNP